MSAMLAIVQRSADNLLLVEDYLARTGPTAEEPATPAPPAAGGPL
jgi:hypothetical protein